MKWIERALRIWVIFSLLMLAVAVPATQVFAQDAATPITLDDAGFGDAQVKALDAKAQAEFTLDLKAGERVAMDLQGDSDALQVAEFKAEWGALEMGGVPEAFNYLVWAPEDGAYTIVVENPGDKAAGFTLRVVVSPAPLPTEKVLTVDADGQSIPVVVGDPFQVALDTNPGAGYLWTLGDLDSAVLEQVADVATVLLGTMPGAISEQIFTLQGVAPGTTTLTLTNARAGDAEPAQTYSVTLEVLAADAAPAAGAVDELGAQLVASFFDALQSGDKEQVAAILAPAFQIVRGAGENYDATNYLDHLPVFESYAVDNVHTTQDGDVVVVAYTVATDTTMDGGAVDMGASAPRLSVFQQIDGAWKLLAHANFVSPAATAVADAGAIGASNVLTITEADNGKTVSVNAGGIVVVDLPGNPTTGYIWQVTANNESILLPMGYSFTPDADAPGAGGMEQFRFNAMAPGTVELALASSRPWETDMPPTATFAVTVDVVAAWPGDNAMILAGMDDSGGTVAILPGGVLIVTLSGAAEGGAWQLVDSDAMVVQILGDWQQTPDAGDATQATFQRAFLGVAPGTTDLQFEYMPTDGSAASAQYALTVEVPAAEPGSSGAVAVTEADAGKSSALVTGDTLVVRLAANPTTGYEWRVVSTNDTILPAAGDPQYAVSNDLMGGGGVATFRFLAKAAGEAAVQIGEFAPGADQEDKTLDFNVTVTDPAPLTGNTVTATDAESGKPLELAAGDLLKVSIAANPTTGYLWLVTANDGALLRLLPESGFTAESDLAGAPGMQDFIFRALGAGEVTLQIGEFPPGAGTPDKTLEYAVTIQ